MQERQGNSQQKRKGATGVIATTTLAEPEIQAILKVGRKLGVKFVVDPVTENAALDTLLESVPHAELMIADFLPGGGVGARPGERSSLSDVGAKAASNLSRTASSGRPWSELRWVQLSAAGINQETGSAVWRESSHVTITTASGLPSVAMAQYIIGMILLHANRVDRLYRDPRDWSIRRELQTQVLTGCTLGILGYGGTGRRTARIAAALGMRVIAIRRSTDSPAIERYLTPEIQDIDTVVDATEVWPIKSLSRLLKESDYVACALPLTSETRGLIGVSEISMMKKGAFLINVSRGRIVDEVALVEALTSGHLGGAALDVFDVEPLPESSSLWSAPNVTLTPHKAGSYDRLSEFMSGLFITNLKRYRAGLGLLNEASRDRGY